jgi:23S rRNA (pseudouridine1915-N3)-methyltransferase
MRFHIIASGRFGRRDSAERTVYHHFARRIVPAPLLREVTEKRALPATQRRRREAELLFAAIPEGAARVALDAGGRQATSREFAGILADWRDAGRRDAAFLIGGDDGLDAGVFDAADLVLSLGPMTWPHLLVRGLLAEQLYRVQCIWAGHPYHRE